MLTLTYKLYTFDNKFIEEVQYVSPDFTGIVENIHGTKCWEHCGDLHRLDGPAIEYFSGRKEWYVDNKQVTELQCKLLHDIMKLKGLL